MLSKAEIITALIALHPFSNSYEFARPFSA